MGRRSRKQIELAESDTKICNCAGCRCRLVSTFANGIRISSDIAGYLTDPVTQHQRPYCRDCLRKHSLAEEKHASGQRDFETWLNRILNCN